MADIQIDQEGLRHNSAALNNQLGQMQELATQLDALINRVGESWQGQSAQAYLEKMMRYAQLIRQMTSVIETYKGYVDSTVQSFVEADSSSAARIRGAF